MTRMFEDMQSGLAEVDAFLAGQRNGYKLTVPAEINVKSIRKALHMTQARFSDVFGFSLDAIKHWEGGRRIPEASARAFLTVIARNPKAVIAALHPPQNESTSATHSRRTSAQRQRKSVAKSPQPVTVHS